MGNALTPMGEKADKLARNALMISLMREAKKGGKTRRISLVADALVNKAISGDMDAIKVIYDRVDGRLTDRVHKHVSADTQLVNALKELEDRRAQREEEDERIKNMVTIDGDVKNETGTDGEQV